MVFIVLGIVYAPFNWHTGALPRDPIPVDAIPDIGDNQQIIATEWMGRSPENIQDQVTYPLTTALLGIPGVQTIRSTSMFGMSFIYIIFKDNIEFYWSRSRILEKLNSLPAGTLPQGVQPTLGPDATALGQIFWYTLEGRDTKTGQPCGGWSPEALRTLQDYYVKYSLAAAEGVSEVASVGGFVKEYQVDVNPAALKAYGVTVMDFHPRHGTVMPITRNELNALLTRWGKPAAFAGAPNNPVLEGYYADPEVLYSNKTHKYYIYPTSDGFTNWAGYYFKTFSSTDLKTWKDEGIILDLKKDVSWANRNAWAPCIIEKKSGRKYHYYFYFSAAQKIGVAVSDNPTGPFKDSGKALIDQKPEGVRGGQQIDQDVFEDPLTGKNYLYWGNGYMAVAELNKDMISIRPNTTRIITPDKTFREGSYVFFRKGIYYFLWSEDDTRSENYRVRYGTSKSPVGPIIVPEQNLVIAKDTAKGIFGTGHNSILQVPGKDEWYIVYHRFNRPYGIKMGDAAGYNREVCIDKLEFNEDGTIKQVVPTL